MSISRYNTLLRLGSQVQKTLLSNTKQHNVMVQAQRWHSHKLYYRSIPPRTKPSFEKIGIFLSAYMWWWILWHAFTEYEEFIGPTFPDPSKWTDEELGVPPLNK